MTILQPITHITAFSLIGLASAYLSELYRKFLSQNKSNTELLLSLRKFMHMIFCWSHPLMQQWKGWLVDCLLFNGNFSTNRLYRTIGVWYVLCRVGGQDKHTIKQWNNTLNQISHKCSSAWALWRWSPCHEKVSSEESF